MKKIYIILAVLATALLASCEREKSFGEVTPLGENDIAFKIAGLSTRSSEGVSTNAVKGITIPLGKISRDESLYLQETIEELNPSPTTKGAPAYTSNVGMLYTTLGVYASGGGFGNDTFQRMDTETVANPNGGTGWRYTHSYGSNPWPTDGSAVDFYLNMPASATGVTFTQRSDKTIKFTYQSELSGESQQDIIFGQTSLTKAQHDSYLPLGAPVMMYHALTGIKFRNGHLNGTQTKTIITKVEITGLKDSGTCTIDSDGAVSWTNLPTVGLSTESPFTMSFSDPDYVAANGASNSDGTVTTWDSNLTGTTWDTLPDYAPEGASAASDHNLNNSDGSLTFWFVPQAMTSDVVLKVYFKVKTPDTVEGSLITHTIKLGELLNEGRSTPVTWEAGQLRTYTLKPFDVDVKITDNLTETTKTNLHVSNTGNVDEYVRILIMGNWYGWKSVADSAAWAAAEAAGDEVQKAKYEPSILVGYQYPSKAAAYAATDPDEDPMVLPWFREGYDGVDPYGSFDSSFSLAKLGTRDGNAYDWADASGGFYYTMPIGPGDGTGQIASATEDLFKSYTVSHVPTIYIATTGNQRVPAVGVHLVMEIVIQAIAVPTVTVGGEEKEVWWLQAWYEATSVDKLDPHATRNAAYVTKYKANAYGNFIPGYYDY